MPYKELSDSTLMAMTKKEIIEQLRIAEHNFRLCEKQFEQHYENTKDWRPVKHGHWVVKGGIMSCSRCGKSLKFAWRKGPNYCSDCGAKFDEPCVEPYEMDYGDGPVIGSKIRTK